MAVDSVRDGLLSASSCPAEYDMLLDDELGKAGGSTRRRWLQQ